MAKRNEVPNLLSTDNDDQETFKYHKQDTPTDSHAVAKKSGLLQQAAREKDGAIIGRKDIAVDASSRKDTATAFEPCILGMSFEDIYILIRRFNLLVFRVRSIESRPLTNLDMGTAEEERTSAEQLQAQLARLYMTVMINLYAAWKHLVRLRSWREPCRTLVFLLVYAVALAADVLVSTGLAFLIVLITYPPSRQICFPFAPPSIINASTGGVQEPTAGVLGSLTSVTGAPENNKGEAVELEAHSFISSFGKLMMRLASDQNPDDGSPEDDPVPGLANLSRKFANAKTKTDLAGQDTGKDMTAEPMKHAIEDFEVQPLLDMLFCFIDTWEQFINALNPTRAFPAQRARILMTTCIVPPLLAALFLPRDILMRSFELGVGFLIFGSPIIKEMPGFLNHRYPDWRRTTYIRNTVLKGVPTHAQLAITIMRAGERALLPVIPHTASNTSPESKTVITANELEHLGATETEIQKAVESNSESETPSHKAEDSSAETEPSSKHLERFMGVVKRSSKVGVRAFFKVDKIKASHGNMHAQARLALSQVEGLKAAPAGPLKFPARYAGKAGHIHITTDAEVPHISWRTGVNTSEAAWDVKIDDIEDVSKVDGMSFKTKHLVRWALDKQSVDGIVLTTTKGERLHITEIIRRDEAFNRLIAIGSQMWEVY